MENKLLFEPAAQPPCSFDSYHWQDEGRASASCREPDNHGVPTRYDSGSPDNKFLSKCFLKTLIRSICAGLALLLATGVLVGCAFSRNKDAEFTPDDPSNYTYELTEENDGYIITGLADDSLTVLRIPKEIEGKPVTSIHYGAFKGHEELTGVFMPSSLEEIHDSAFEGCTGLTEITIPSTVKMIGYSAFADCTGLTKITLPSSLEEIYGYTFENCTNLTEMTIPSSVTSIDVSAFSDCEKLINIVIDKHNENYTSEDGIIYNKDQTKLIYYPEGKSGECTVLSSVRVLENDFFNSSPNLKKIIIHSRVKSIDVSVFKGCHHLAAIEVDADNKKYASEDGVLYNKKKTKYLYCPEEKEGTHTIPSSVTTIGQNDFNECMSLREIVIPASVTSIDEWAFRECGQLVNINVDPNNENFKSENGILYNDEMTEMIACPGGKTGKITIPASVKNIGNYACYECKKIEEITFAEPSSVTSIGKSAFCKCSSVEAIMLPSSVKSMEDYAFYKCKGLTDITITEPSSLKSIGNWAFSKATSLSSFTIPSSVRSIGDDVFRDCVGLKKMTIPSSVTHIGEYVFQNCDGLESVTIESPVTYVNNGVFYSCDNLLEVNLPATVKTIGYSSFAQCYHLAKLPSLSSVTEIGEYAFQACDSLKEIIIPASVTRIGFRAFSGCDNVSRMVVADNNPNYSSQSDVLYNKDKSEILFCCGKKQGNFTIPSSVKKIGDSSFEDCKYLTEVKLSSSVAEMDSNPFYGCDQLVRIDVDQDNPYFSSEDGILYNKDRTEILAYPYGKEDISQFTIPSSVKGIAKRAFIGCYHLKEIEIPSSVKTIGDQAFFNCDGLTEIVIPSSVKSIGEMAFRYSDSLSKVHIPASVKTIGDYAFADCYATIYGEPGSYAEKYAKDNDISFAVNDNAV